MKKIAVGDLGEFWYGDYKEPFVQLEGAVPGYPQGVILKDDVGKLLCAFCGRTYDQLGTHTTRTHGMRGSEYKEAVGLLQKSALASERQRLVGIRNGLRNASKGKLALARYRRRSSGQQRYKGRVQPVERQNMSGRCYEQLLVRGRALLREHGHLTHKLLRHHGISELVINQRFGSIERYRHLVGDPRPSNQRRAISDAELLDAFRLLALQLGRTPQVSDIARYGLPSFNRYRARFGSHSNLCVRAGLTPTRYVPQPGTDAEILSAYAISGDYQKVGRALHYDGETIRRVLARYGVPIIVGGSHATRVEVRTFAAEVAARLEGMSEHAA